MRQRLATASLLLLLVGTVPAVVAPQTLWDGTGGMPGCWVSAVGVEMAAVSGLST